MTAIEKRSEEGKSRWRIAFGQYPTGVTILTSVDEAGEPVGMVVGTFTSVSQNPPLVGFFPARSSTTFPHIQKTGRFRASVLGASHEDLCRLFFSSPRSERFSVGDWEYDEHGIPVLRDAVAWFDATITHVTPAGDHCFVLGEVDNLGIGGSGSGMPLIFLRGGYGSFTIPRLEFDLGHVGGQLRVAAGLSHVVQELAERLDVECVLASLERDSIVVLTAANVRSPQLGMAFPFAAPMAPGFCAWSDEDRRLMWQENARHLLGSVDESLLDEMIEDVHRQGYAVSFGQVMSDQFDAVVGAPQVDRDMYAALWGSLVDEYRRFMRSDHPERDVTVVQAPVFGVDGMIELELVVSGFGPNAGAERYRRILRDTLSCSAELTRMIGGAPPKGYSPKLS
ncbi:flavin reductase [Amycolatopsis lurida]